MEQSNIVYLLVGQRGSGKSTYAKKLLEKDSGITIISRDEILIRLFGNVHTNPYSGASSYGMEVLRRLLRYKLSTKNGLKIVLDCWTGDSQERKVLIKVMRQYGATKVIALYFVTPLQIVSKWFWKKPGVARVKDMGTQKEKNLVFFSDNAPKQDYELFHDLAKEIYSDGFDQVFKINPLKKIISFT